MGIRADEQGRIAARVREETHAQQGLESVVDRITTIIKELAGETKIDGVGVGIPGPLDPAKGLVYDPPNLPGWGTVPLAVMLKERLAWDNDIPIVLVNDANAAALAEYKFGAGKETGPDGRSVQELVYLTISTGIGGGVIAGGKLLLGATGMAAELGHVVIDVWGQRCSCGGRGCFEAMASGTALAREATIVVASRRPTSMAQAVEGQPEGMSAEIVVKAAQEGDPEACVLMEREALLVGVGVVNCIHSFNPQVVVIGGGVSNADDLLFTPVRATVDERVMPAYKGTFRIEKAVLGGDSGALGAVAAVLEGRSSSGQNGEEKS